MSDKATPSASFSEQFTSQFSESLSKYKRLLKPSDSSDSSGPNESSDDDSSSTGTEGPEYVSNGKGKEWRIEVGRQLQQALDTAMLVNAKDEKIQLHREIGVYRNFVQLEYFEALEQYPETTIDLIREEITKAANESSLLEYIGDVESFSPSLPSSPLSSNLASVLGSSPPKLLRLLPKSKRLAKALTAVRQGSSIRQAAATYGVNRKTMANRISGKHAGDTSRRSIAFDDC